MNAYFRSILVTTAGCHLVLLAVKELGGESSEKVLRFLCGILLLLTMFAPLQSLTETIYNFVASLETISETETSPTTEDPQTFAAQSAYAYIADSWMKYLSDCYTIPREDIRLTFHTDSENTLVQAEVALRNCYYARRQTIEEDLQKQTDIPITVKGW